jgi:hypothetical protein
MRLFVQVTLLKAGTYEPSAEAELMECPADVEPDTILSFLNQVFGDVIETAWTTTERHAHLACGWIFTGTTKNASSDVLCVLLLAMDDGTLRSMFELQADERAEFDELARSGEVDDYTIVERSHRAYEPEKQANPSEKPSARRVSTGGGHRHGAGRAGSTEFPATWTNDQVIAHIIDVARHPDVNPVWQPNQLWHLRGIRDGVDIIVLMERDGAVLTAWPLAGGRGVQQNPSWSDDPEEAQLAQAMKHLPDRFSDRLDPDETDALRMMAEAGEWAEEVDLLIATLADKQQGVTDHERLNLTDLLGQLGLTTDQLDLLPCAHR